MTNVIFKKGYTVYEESSKTVIVCPHSGPSLMTANSRDDNSDTVGSLLWRQMKGKLVIGNLSRSRYYGVDFNRDIPPMNIAIEGYTKFENDTDNKFKFEYMKKYAWVAKDENDYHHRLNMYQNFWNECEDAKNIILMHRSYNRIRNIPSVIDFVTFKEKGIKQSKIRNTIKYVTRNYAGFFQEVSALYKRLVFQETEKLTAKAIHKFKTFKLDKMSPEIKDGFLRDINVMKKYSRGYLIRRLKDNFNVDNYLVSVKDALDNSPVPTITLENIFDGTFAFGPKRKLFPWKDKFIVEVEVCQFMSEWYPETSAKMIKEVIEMIR
jgi:hypothetical protein